MKKLLSILLILVSLNSIGQTTQTFIKDSFYFGSNLTPSSSHSKSLFAGRWVADTTVIKNRDTTWHPLYDGTTTTYQGILYVWYQGKWYVGSSGGGGSGSDTAYLLQGFGVKLINIINPTDSFYKPNGVNITLSADTSGLRNYFNQFYGNTTIINDSSVTVFIVDSIANTPTGSEANGTKYLVGTSPTGVFAGHANSVATLVGAVWNFTVPEQQDQLINDNADFYATYQFNGVAWVQTNVLWVVGGNRNIGNNAYMGRNDSVPVIFKSNGQTFLIGDQQGFMYNPVFSGLENGTYYFKPGVNGKFDTAKFKELVAISPLLLTSGVTGDTLSCAGCGGGTITASNGIIKVSNDLRLGGSLTSTTVITTGASFGLTFNGTGGATPLSGFTTGIGNGISGTSGSGFGVFGNAGATGYGGVFQTTTSTDNAAVQVLQIRPTLASGGSANGFGGSIDFANLTAGVGGTAIANRMISTWTNATFGTRTSQLQFTGLNSGTTNNLLTLSGAGQETLNQYNLTNFYVNDTTANKPLVINSSGVVSSSSWVGGGGGGGGIHSVNAGTGLTKVNDSTLALTTPVSIANGGTNNGSLSVTAGTVYYGDGTKLVSLAPGTSSQILHSGTTPSWKDTTAIPTYSGGVNRMAYWTSSTNLSKADSIFVDNTNNRVGFGSSSPTAAITIDSARGYGASTGAINIYKTQSQVTNYSKFTIKQGTFGWYIGTERSGTGLNGNLELNSSAAYIEAAGDAKFKSVYINGGVTNLDNSGQAFIGTAVYTPILRPIAVNALGVSIDAGATNSSGTSGSMNFAPQIATTGTGGNFQLRIAPYYSGVGSGKHLLLEMGERNSGSTVFTCNWRVFRNAHTIIGDSTDNGYMLEVKGTTKLTAPIAFVTSTPSSTAGTGAGTSPTISITGTNAAGYVSITTGTSPTASGNIVTITFSTALTNTPTSIQLTPAGENAATELTKFYVDQATASTTAFIIKNTSSALTASTTYKFYYTVTQ